LQIQVEAGSQKVTKNYHSKCFICTQCSSPLKADSFHTLSGFPLCTECYEEQKRSLVTIKSHGVVPQKTSGSSVEALNAARAKKNDGLDEFQKNVHSVDPSNICDACYAAFSSSEPKIQLPNGRVFHPDCFNCSGCGKVMNSDSKFAVSGGNYYHPGVRTKPEGFPSKTSPLQQNLVIITVCDRLFIRHLVHRLP
jgi:paxillin